MAVDLIMVSYLMNADGDPTNFARKGYLLKHKVRLEKEGGFKLEDREKDATHIPQWEVIKFFDDQCRKHLTECKESGWYYHRYCIELADLQSKSESSVFLTILLDAYQNNDLSKQVGIDNFCKGI